MSAYRYVMALLLLLGALAAYAEDKAPAGTRYGIAPDLKEYPQGTPKEALASILKAVEARRVDYVVAQLADPAFIDDRVQRVYGGRFKEQVEDTRGRLDPRRVKQMGRFLRDGEWDQDGSQATVKLKDDERRLFFKKDGDRWFLANPMKPEKR